MKLKQKKHLFFAVIFVISILIEYNLSTKIQNKLNDSIEQRNEELANEKKLREERLKGSKSHQDPFKSLGLSELNTKEIMDEINKDSGLENQEDIPKFVQSAVNLSDEEVIQVISRFLLIGPLSQYNAVFDKTGFDALPGTKQLSLNPFERCVMRLKSAAVLYVSIMNILISSLKRNIMKR